VTDRKNFESSGIIIPVAEHRIRGRVKYTQRIMFVVVWSLRYTEVWTSEYSKA